MAYIEEKSRDEYKVECLESAIAKDNQVRVIDAFIDSYNKPMGKVCDKDAGRNAYNPKSLAKLLLYGYAHNIRSSRKLAEATRINIEVRWLLGELEPDFRTISDFRKDNLEAIKDMFFSFLEMIKPSIEYGHQSVDGSKLQANNGKDKNFTLNKLDDRIAWKKAHINEWLKLIDINDITDGDIIEGEYTKEELLDKISKYKVILNKYEEYRDRMEKECLSQISLTDEDSRLMKFKNDFNVGYNMQTAVDSNSHLITSFKATNKPTDHGQIESTVSAIKETNFKNEIMEVVADKGYIQHEDMAKCLMSGIVPNVILPDGHDTIELEVEYKECKDCDKKSKESEELSKCLKSGKIPDAYKGKIDKIEIVDKRIKIENKKKIVKSQYGTEEEMKERASEGYFVRDPERNIVYCPNGETLRLNSIKSAGGMLFLNKLACDKCPDRHKCIQSKRKWKEVEFTKDSLEIPAKNHKNYLINKKDYQKAKGYKYEYKKVCKIFFRPNKEKMDTRKNLSEHPFGTIKRSLGGTYFLLRGIEKIATEFSLLCLSYNMKRAINYIGFDKTLQLVRA